MTELDLHDAGPYLQPSKIAKAVVAIAKVEKHIPLVAAMLTEETVRANHELTSANTQTSLAVHSLYRAPPTNLTYLRQPVPSFTIHSIHTFLCRGDCTVASALPICFTVRPCAQGSRVSGEFLAGRKTPARDRTAAAVGRMRLTRSGWGVTLRSGLGKYHCPTMNPPNTQESNQLLTQ